MTRPDMEKTFWLCQNPEGVYDQEHDAYRAVYRGYRVNLWSLQITETGEDREILTRQPRILRCPDGRDLADHVRQAHYTQWVSAGSPKKMVTPWGLLRVTETTSETVFTYGNGRTEHHR